jgi:hypothetical protein
MEHKFINKTKKVSLSQVDFKEYFEFYKNFICPFLYNYTLEDGTEIDIKFYDEYFAHLLGLHKFQTLKSYKKMNRLIEDILSEKIDFKNIYSAERNFIDKNIELRDRLTYFPVLKTLLENTTSALKYDLNVVWNSKIEFSFLLRSNKITILVYLAVKEIKGKKKICVPVSLLVDRNERFLKMGLKELKVISSKITNK